LLKRLITTLILVLFSVLVIISRWLSGIVISLLIIIGLYEFFSMIEKKDIYAYKYFGLAVGAIIPISILFQFELTKSWELFFVVLALLALILMQLRRGKSSGVINAISTTIFGILYVSWFLSFMIKIRFMNNGMGLLTTLLLITKLGDIGAFVVGKRFGKKLLFPQVSPHKSIEGAFGGLLFSILGALVSRPFVQYSYWHLIFLGVFLGILAQLGDLSESLIKRDCGVKDSSDLLPGLGGILDLIDSLLFTAPVFYFYMSIILK
jgi:phosphatidate cytidylyltransferase